MVDGMRLIENASGDSGNDGTSSSSSSVCLNHSDWILDSVDPVIFYFQLSFILLLSFSPHGIALR